MKKGSLKDAQATFMKTITWTKKFKKGGHEWEKVCHEVALGHRKLKTLTNFQR